MNKILQTFKGNYFSTPPIWMMRQAGRYLPEYMKVRGEAGSFLKLCYTPEMAKIVTLQPIERYHLDAAILFSDILVIPHGLGQKLWFVEGEGPKLNAIKDDISIIKSLNLESFYDILSPVYEAVSLIKNDLNTRFSNVPLIGFSGAPWTLLTYMINGGSNKSYDNVIFWLLNHKNEADYLLKILIEAIVKHLSYQINAGVDLIQLFDSWAGVLPDPLFHKWVVKPNAEIVKKLKEIYPEVPIIAFPKGIGGKLKNYLDFVECDGISIDHTISIEMVKEIVLTKEKNCGRKTVIQGNLDPRILLYGGELLNHSVLNILEQTQSTPFIFNLSHGIIKETPVENVQQMINLIKNR